MNIARIAFILIGGFFLAGCEEYAHEQRLREEQLLRHQRTLQTEQLNHNYRVTLEQARIEAEAEQHIAETQAREQRLLDEHNAGLDATRKTRRDALAIVAGAIAAPAVTLLAGFFWFAGYRMRMRNAALAIMAGRMSEPERQRALGGLLAAQRVDVSPLLLEYRRR